MQAAECLPERVGVFGVADRVGDSLSFGRHGTKQTPEPFPAFVVQAAIGEVAGADKLPHLGVRPIDDGIEQAPAVAPVAGVVQFSFRTAGRLGPADSGDHQPLSVLALLEFLAAPAAMSQRRDSFLQHQLEEGLAGPRDGYARNLPHKVNQLGRVDGGQGMERFESDPGHPAQFEDGDAVLSAREAEPVSGRSRQLFMAAYAFYSIRYRVPDAEQGVLPERSHAQFSFMAPARVSKPVEPIGEIRARNGAHRGPISPILPS